MIYRLNSDSFSTVFHFFSLENNIATLNISAAIRKAQFGKKAFKSAISIFRLPPTLMLLSRAIYFGIIFLIVISFGDFSF